MIKITRKPPEYVYYLRDNKNKRYWGPLTRKPKVSKTKKQEVIKYKLEELK